jgi:hypothetical protein
MIEHEPWIGEKYAREGIGGQRVGVVGYSAWVGRDSADSADFTVRSVQGVVSNEGDWRRARFYTDIPRYFDRMTIEDFYPRVVFFEFVPCAIGGPDAKYNTANEEQAQVGRYRTLRLIRDHAIDKLLIFSGKANAALAPLIRSDGDARLGDTKFRIGTIDAGSHRATAVCLRHPQYAPGKLMRSAVAYALALPPRVKWP